MKKFILLYKGFEQPTPEIGQAWMDWFASIADRTVDSGQPFSSGVEVTAQGVNELAMDREVLTGYSIINAETREEAIGVAQTNPMITSVVVYELAKM